MELTIDIRARKMKNIIPAGLILFLIISIMIMPDLASANVVRVEIKSREVVSESPEHSRPGPYEVIKGIIYLEVDPNAPANQLIVDLKLAKRNDRGNIEFSTDFELHKPVDANRGNHRLIYFVNNRGNKIGTWHFNHQADGNWLYRQGYSYLWCGWNSDVIESDRKLNIRVPIATEKGKTITGRIYAEMISYADEITYSYPIVWGGSMAYSPVNMDKSDAKLTMRQYRNEKPIEIPHEEWEYARQENGEIMTDSGSIYIKEGFKPGWLYDLVYIGKNPRVTGLGLAAIRDVVSFFRYETEDKAGNDNPLAGVVEHTFAWGHSQSGRLLNHFVYQNFNGDEKNQIVFDGIMSNSPGAGKGLFNSRFAQFTRHGSHHEDKLFPIDFFPFATVEQNDPVTGKKEYAFNRAQESGFMPKMMFINSSTDYWTRAASLLHTDVDGKRDIEIDSNVRIYAIAGRAHVDDRIGIIGRALLTGLDQWVSFGIEPPGSQLPKISDGSLVSLDELKNNFPYIPDILMPESFYHPYRLDMGRGWESKGIAKNVPPKIGKPFVCLVPQVDKDGNEIAGIRLPEVDVPLATYTGWRMRNPSYSNSLGRNTGSVYPFPKTPEAQIQTSDPRESIIGRYSTKKDYLFKVTKSLLYLKHQRFLLDEDFTRLLLEAAQQDYWSATENASTVIIKEIIAQPVAVEAGGRILLSVKFEGLQNAVLMVSASFREATNLNYWLNDDGNNGDEIAGDNIWSCGVEIPGNVPAGQFHFDLKCLNIELNHIHTKNTAKEGKGKQGSVVFIVK